jgi:ribonuclease-3
LPEFDEQQQRIWSALEERLGYRFADRSLLVRALTHRSYANESRNPAIVDNERLEFLGDAVLDLVIGAALFNIHGGADEGELSRLRADLVSETSLARLARKLALGDCLLLGRGEARSGGRDKDSLLANTLEAIIGAGFVDGGYAAGEAIVGRLFAGELTGVTAAAGEDYKTRLQELLQARRQLRPEYRLAAARGPDHQRSYEVEVVIAGKILGRGDGTTKKRAEQSAARHALAHLGANGEDMDG